MRRLCSTARRFLFQGELALLWSRLSPPIFNSIQHQVPVTSLLGLFHADQLSPEEFFFCPWPPPEELDQALSSICCHPDGPRTSKVPGGLAGPDHFQPVSPTWYQMKPTQTRRKAVSLLAAPKRGELRAETQLAAQVGGGSFLRTLRIVLTPPLCACPGSL